ncbi:protein-L-isoaspartate(D-aspartate) O-methyltransferase [Methylobacterium planeticum]|uniref:protein-L-isoaspartate(D-aspartate) O-methyltransferase n=1 Tax=Methylobacterium planeticum TaxID=2615211 RepID=UPI001FEE8462|nr:protein-L-isoaspartate(D-aspartate) O-methyltransferase [Methylobacterium planeticum]
MAQFARQRAHMVARQIAARGLTDARLLAAVRAVPRECFVPPHLRAFAYEDGPLPIAAGQTISQPYIVALMIDAAALAPGDRVLEIGAGSGYAAAVMSRLAAEILAVERHALLAEEARRCLGRLGYGNVAVRHGDGTLGWPEAAPFDAIVVAAGGPEVPGPLRRQLRIGGRLVMPVGARPGSQRLVRLLRRGEEDFSEDALGLVSFVPLIGAEGWAEDPARRDAGRYQARSEVE